MSKPTFCVKVIYKNSIPSLAITCNCVEVYIYGEMPLIFLCICTQNGHWKRSRAVVLMEECFRGLAWRSVFTVIGPTIMESIWTQLGSGCLYWLREIPMSHVTPHPWPHGSIPEDEQSSNSQWPLRASKPRPRGKTAMGTGYHTQRW